MNILLLGGGGREHALAWKIAQSPKCSQLFIAPGNGGTRLCGTNYPLDITDFSSIEKFSIENNIQMVVPGPEDPLVNGISDYFLANKTLRDIPLIGPSRQAAQLEGSKDFAKAFMTRHNIPTAAYRSFTEQTRKDAKAFLEELSPPYVLKADGLAAGKGVVIVDDIPDAIAELDAMFSGKFGQAGKTVVIEQFLRGRELSVFAVTDGANYRLLPAAKDYKKIGAGDSGLNTGGMGAVSGVPFADARFMELVEKRVVRPTIEGLQQEGIVYKGFLFFGLIEVGGNPYVIEYNVRLGDPETESLIPRLKTDIVSIFEAVASENVDNIHIDVDERFTATVMLVSGGYPGNYEKGKVISGLDEVRESLLFHAGTRFDGPSEQVYTNGGRVLAVTSYGATLREALKCSYEQAASISFDGMYYRKDIGFDML
jgi:phosphoribosylamine---glycine ligase